LRRLEYLLFLLFVKFVTLLPYQTRHSFMIAFGSFAHMIAFRHKKIVKANLDLIYGKDINNFYKEHISKECFKNMALSLLTMIEAPLLDKEKQKQRLKVINQDILDQLKESNRPLILVTGHYGNLDMLAYMMGNFVTTTTHVAKKINNPLISKFIEDRRKSFGLNVVEKDGAAKSLVKTLKNSGVVSLVIDHHTIDREGVKIKFMGKEATQSDTPANLSLKFNAPIVPFFIFRTSSGYEIKFFEPILPSKESELSSEKKKSEIIRLTQKQADVISKVIYEDPSKWFWCHKRWKSNYRYIYN
jgi:KDO2-lipid IV(A) lauroyltransferase